MKPILQYLMICLVILPVSAGWTSPPPGPIKVAAIFAKTGKAAAGNLNSFEGIRFAVGKLNQKGGILGQKIELMEFDNHSTPMHSKKAAQKAVESGVSIVFGANWSSHSMAMAKVLEKARIPMIAIYSTNPDVTRVGNYIFRVCFIDPFQGRIMSNFAFQDLKARTASVLINTSGRYSEGLADYFIRDFKAKGGKILFKEGYLHDTLNFSLLLEKIIPLKPDVVFVPGNILDSARIIKQARESGLMAPFLGGDGWGDSMYAHAGEALEGAFFSVHWHQDMDSNKNRQFVKEYRNFSKVPVDSGTALAYDAVFLFAHAAKRAHSVEPERVRQALAATRDFKGIAGNITFNEHRNPIKPAVILKFGSKSPVFVKAVNP